MTATVTKVCKHGDRFFKESVSKDGKIYAGWICPASGPGRCYAEWVPPNVTDPLLVECQERIVSANREIAEALKDLEDEQKIRAALFSDLL